MRKVGCVLAMTVTMAACGANSGDSDVSTKMGAISTQYTYWTAGTKTTWAGGGRTSASCGNGDVMLGLSLQTPPQILCGVLPSGSVLDYGHKYSGGATRDGLFPACDWVGNSSDAAMAWQIDYPAFATTVTCASSVYSTVGNQYVDDLQGQGTITDSFGTSFIGHHCATAGSVAIGYDGDNDLLLCAY